MACGLCFSCCGWCGTLRYRDFTLKGTQLLFAFSGTFNRFDIQALFVLPCVCAQELTFRQVLIINITAALGLFSLARLVVEFTLEFLLSRRRK